MPPRKIVPNPKTNLNPNPNPNQGAIFPLTNPNLDRNPNPNKGQFSLGRQLPGHRFYQDMMQISNNPNLKKNKYTPTHVPTICYLQTIF